MAIETTIDILEFEKLPEHIKKKLRSAGKKPKTTSEKIQEAIRYGSMNETIFPEKYRPGAASVTAPAGARAAQGAADDAPPITNRGVTSLPSYYALEHLEIIPVGHGGKCEFIRIPKRDKSYSDKHAFIDYVTFGYRVSDLPLSTNTGHQSVTDYDYVQALSSILYGIFGFGVIGQRKSGMNFYEHSFDLGPNGYGLVCIGGQKDTVSITVKGQGLIASKAGWEQRLFNFLLSIKSARLSRVDLASDNFHSKNTLDDYLQMWRAGLFTNRGAVPEVETVGNWEKPNGKGRTLYVGSRKSGKLLRIYEKGLQIGQGYNDKFPHWVRIELELKSQNRVIPLGVLLHPGQYFAGSYPALAGFNQVQETIKTFKNTAVTTAEKSLEITRVQFGRYIWALSELYGRDEFFKMVTRDRECLPAKLEHVIHFNEEFPESDFIHTDTDMVWGADEIYYPATKQTEVNHYV